MENDYLWDKTGEDAEIEQLEKTLQVFRYQGIDASDAADTSIADEAKVFALFVEICSRLCHLFCNIAWRFYRLAKFATKTRFSE